MAVRKILLIGDPRLKAESQIIKNFKDPKIKKVIQDLKDTMIKKDLIGMAAPQIGYNYKIFITQPRKTKARKLFKGDKLRVYINPKLVKLSKVENVIYEGCGCVPNLFGPVKRPQGITIEAFDIKGDKFQIRCDGILARVIQHENDHMVGIEFTDKIMDYKKLMWRDTYYKNIRNSDAQLQASKITIVDYKKI